MSVELLIDEFQIRDRLLAMGRQIEADYRDKPLTIVAVLTGSLIALADLVRQIGIPLRIALLQASSYRVLPRRQRPWLSMKLLLRTWWAVTSCCWMIFSIRGRP